MSQWEKLLQRIRQNPKSVRFTEIRKILERYGYKGTQPRNGSSHWTFRKKGCPSLTVPRKEPFVKEVYVRMVIDVLEAEKQ